MASSGIVLAAYPSDAGAPRSLRVSFAWALTGNGFYAASQWAAIAMLARLGDPAVVGQFALGLAITSPLVTCTNLQLRTVQATATGGRFCLGHYVTLRLLGTTAFLLAVAIVAAGAGYRGATLAALGAVAALRAADALSDVLYGYLHAQERFDRIAQSQILKAAASLAAMWLTIRWTGSCRAGIVALAVASWLTLAVVDRAIVARIRGPQPWFPPWRGSRILELFETSLPLGLTLLLVSLNANLPRYFLEHYRGVEQVGVFSALAYVTISANLFVMALGQAAAPRMAQASTTNRRLFVRWSVRLFTVAAAVGGLGLAVAVVAGRPLLQLLYGAPYAQEQRVFVWLMFSGLVSYLSSAAGYSLTSARYFRAQFPILLVVCAVTAAACALLVPSQGLVGAAVAQAGGYGVQLGCSLAYLIWTLRRGLPPRGEVAAAGGLLLKPEV